MTLFSVMTLMTRSAVGGRLNSTRSPAISYSLNEVIQTCTNIKVILICIKESQINQVQILQVVWTGRFSPRSKLTEVRRSLPMVAAILKVRASLVQFCASKARTNCAVRRFRNVTWHVRKSLALSWIQAEGMCCLNDLRCDRVQIIHGFVLFFYYFIYFAAGYFHFDLK